MTVEPLFGTQDGHWRSLSGDPRLAWGRREGGKEEPSGRPMRARVSLGLGTAEDTSL